MPQTVVLVSGKVISFVGDSKFELQCLHDSKQILTVDQYLSSYKIENGGILVSAVGKLKRAYLGYILDAEDIQIDGTAGNNMYKKMNEKSAGSSHKSGGCH